MEQVKIFSESDTHINEVVNRWLTENSEVEITRVAQSQSRDYASVYVTLTIFYKASPK